MWSANRATGDRLASDARLATAAERRRSCGASRRRSCGASRRPWRLAGSVVLASALGAGSAWAVTPGAATRFDDPALAGVAATVGVGGRLQVMAVPLGSGVGPSTLDLRRFRVFRPNAHIVVHGAAGERLMPPPARAYFRGTVAAEPGSLVVLAVGGAGDARGLVTVRGRHFVIAAAAAGAAPAGSPRAGTRDTGKGLQVHPLAAAAAPAASAVCAAGDLPDLAPLAVILARPTGVSAVGASAAGRGPLAAAVAVETDWELFEALGSAAAVAAYAGDLFAAASAVYQRDVSTGLEIGFLSVWETPADPFAVTSGFFDALYELGDYWHAAHLGTPRTITHFLSGKNGLQGGVAYHGVLCSPDVLVQGHWGGGYSLTGALVDSGLFRDTFIMSHEIGHNFRSHHTHCYNDLPALGDPPVDRCISGEIRNDGHPCYAGPTSLPADGGSIMSYCHLQPGGYANVSLSLGEKGSFGEGSERVLQRMTDHIESVGCLVPAAGTIFADGFESGDTSRWSASAGG